MPRKKGLGFSQEFIEDLERKTQTTFEALKLAVDAKEKLDTDATNKNYKAGAVERVLAARAGYYAVDQSISPLIGTRNLLTFGAHSRLSALLDRYFLSCVIGETAATILYHILGTLGEQNFANKHKPVLIDEREIYAVIEGKNPRWYYHSVRAAAIKLSTYERFNTILKVLEYVMDRYPKPILEATPAPR